MTGKMTSSTSVQLTDPRRKKLLFRGWHRGTREADLLVGRFAEDYLQHCSDTDLDVFERLLEEGDPDIFDWVSGKEPMPQNDLTTVLLEMVTFYQARA